MFGCGRVSLSEGPLLLSAEAPTVCLWQGVDAYQVSMSCLVATAGELAVHPALSALTASLAELSKIKW